MTVLWSHETCEAHTVHCRLTDMFDTELWWEQNKRKMIDCELYTNKLQ